MKRCHRLRDSITDPYQEFSFEKSLRKYEKTPTKKVKMDLLLHHRNALHPVTLSQRMQHHHFAEQEEEAEAVVVERQQLKEEDKEENKIDNADKEVMDDGLIEEHSQRESNQIEREIVKESPTVSKEMIAEQMPAKQEVHLLAAKEPHQHQQPLPTHHTKNTIQSTNPISGGRFHLNSHIFISQRSLARMGKQHGEASIVEELLRKRSYLESQREAIASRLREFIKNQ